MALVGVAVRRSHTGKSSSGRVEAEEERYRDGVVACVLHAFAAVQPTVAATASCARSGDRRISEITCYWM